MTKEIKKCFYRLNLPYSASEEEILTNEKVKIKILRTKAEQNKRSYDKKIKRIVADTQTILDYIKNNGPITNIEPLFNTSIKSIYTQIVVLVCLLVAFFTCLFNII